MNKALSNVFLLAGLLVGNLIACAAPAADTARATLESAIHRWVEAVNAQDVTTLTATMTEDVELSDDSTTVTGRENVIRALREHAARAKLIAATREITISSDVAWHKAGLAQARENGDVQAAGEALENWKRVDGQWKLHRRKVTGDADPEVSVTRPSTKEPVLDR
jgi:ketosteroid isomerase-like protein